MPAAARGTSPAAAKAFVRYYFELLNRAMITGETTDLRGLSSPRCASCNAIAKNIETTYSNGGYIESNGWTVQSMNAVPNQPRKKPILDLGVFMTKEEVAKAADQKPETFRGGKQPMTIHLAWANQGWRVLRLDLVS